MLSRIKRPTAVVRTHTPDGLHDEYSLFISAPPERLWDLVSDITRMGRWSPENRAGVWLSRSRTPVPGAWFVGVNRIGPVVWATPCQITVVEPDRHFEFQVHGIGTRWGYRLQPASGGTLVTEYRRWPDTALLLKLLKVSGPLGKPRDNLALHGLQQSLHRLREIAEARP
ncbi:SRPBCC family protein [Nocardia huaxiensis]|uniref:SRPBCC family protein n=1 Tax=Nocardia huaxiensis TaxID=2755382 RepID=A0A7D6Z5N8_9NOCA|nr:SRPBCC family protein [Nocardia huaxiensis]QLY33646.1 SRPBCC family protein [Nocardia huaxiensis]UFS99439.1 SRPBCC family protein [Nocardia huaxiensis]